MRNEFTVVYVNRVLMMFALIDVFHMMGAEGVDTEIRSNRVVRWAAGYNVVRMRESDRRFHFSQYPDSKDNQVKF